MPSHQTSRETYGFSHNNLASRRRRFIVRTADLSAFGGFHNIPVILLITISMPRSQTPNKHWKLYHKDHPNECLQWHPNEL